VQWCFEFAQDRNRDGQFETVIEFDEFGQPIPERG